MGASRTLCKKFDQNLSQRICMHGSSISTAKRSRWENVCQVSIGIKLFVDKHQTQAHEM